MASCRNCNARSELVICWNCAKMIRRQLVELPWYLARLNESAYGLAKLGKAKAPVSQGERIPGPAYNDRAGNLLVECRGKLTQWWLQTLADGATPVPAGDDCAQALAKDVGALMAYPYAADALRWLLAWRANAERAIDLPPDMKYAGPCRSMALDTGERCGTPLYVEVGECVAACPVCGIPFLVDDLQEAALERVRRQLRCATDMWRFTKWLGRPVPRSSFYRLLGSVPARLDDDGAKLYRWRDVEAALDDWERQRAERRAERIARAAERELLTAQQDAS